MMKGGCYCGAVRYEADKEFLMFAYCHCPDCRKYTGSAFVSVLVVESDGFRITTGEDRLTTFESSPGKKRHFCATCGCHIHMVTEQRPGKTFLRAGSLEDDPGILPQFHFWTAHKAPWYEICDDLPQYPEGLPASRLN